MTNITVRMHFSFPFSLASDYLRDGLTEVAETGTHRLQLTAHLPATAIELSKSVRVECVADPGDPGTAWLIRWTPEPGGVYPSFSGRFSVAKDESARGTLLELTGSYEPPLESVGRVFDYVLGRKVATETAHDILRNIAAMMKARYAYEEARLAYAETASDREEQPPQWSDVRF